MKLKAILTRIKNSIWLYPTLYSIFAVILAYLVILLDYRIYYDLNPYVPFVLLTSTELAKSVLTIIASAFITIMTFSFSTTMVVLTMYSSQFSPRVVENFLANKSTMKALGVFISGFIYSIITLLFIRSSLGDAQILAGSIGVIYIIVAIIHFILFINNVGTQVQASNLIDRLYHRADDKVKVYANYIKNYSIIEKDYVSEIKIKTKIQSSANGYIQSINYKKIHELAKDANIMIIINKVPGQFLTDKAIIGGIYHNDSITLDKSLTGNIQESIIIGDRRTEIQDFNFSIQKIVDLALKSLSPGINDPNTAKECIQNLGLIIRDLAHLDEGYVSFKNQEDKTSYLYWEKYSLDLILQDAFFQIIHYGQDDFSITTTLLKSYRNIMESSSEKNKEIVLNHVLYLWNKIQDRTYQDIELKMLRNEYEDILLVRRTKQD